MHCLAAIVGPTGIGKSQLALKLAHTFNGEIVNADSRQIYRHMDIGTAKPSPEELAQIPHHLINIADPDEDFSLAQYRELAGKAINDIQERDKPPLLVGGTGQYVWALLEGWEVPRVPPDMEFRHRLEEQAAAEGIELLYQRLQETDPPAAERIDKRNIRRVIRALEVHQQTKTPFSELKRKSPPEFHSLLIGLTASREEVYRRVDQRVDRMMEIGFVAEVEKLINMGYPLSLPSMSSIGYRQIGKHLKGEISMEETYRQIKTGTHRIVRHQYAWFRLNDERIHWFDMQRYNEQEISKLVSEFIDGGLK